MLLHRKINIWYSPFGLVLFLEAMARQLPEDAVLVLKLELTHF